jgi:hypothetical protein
MLNVVAQLNRPISRLKILINFKKILKMQALRDYTNLKNNNSLSQFINKLTIIL